MCSSSNSVVVTMADVKKLGWSDGQAFAQKFLVMLGDCVYARRMGKTPLTVTNCSPGVQVRVINPFRKDYYLEPDMDIEELTERFVCDQMEDSEVRDKFLSGRLRLRAKCWQIGKNEVMLLANKPTHRIITVSLKNKGDTIAFRNEEGTPYALTK